MSIQAQQKLAVGLSLAMALAVAGSLLLVGWALYRPTEAPTTTAQLLEH